MLQNQDRSAPDGAGVAARPATLRLVHDAPGPPAALSSFVGREAELAAVAEALGRARLLTLTGPGGAGKTRLAAEAARRASGAVARGVWWVELAPLGDGALVAGAVLAALGERLHPGRPAAEQLAEALRGRARRRPTRSGAAPTRSPSRRSGSSPSAPRRPPPPSA
jgi:hypothetical protein